MTDTKRLQQTVNAAGLPAEFIAERLGITPEAYKRKAAGVKEFMAQEIQTMRSILALSAEDTLTIFFS